MNSPRPKGVDRPTTSQDEGDARSSKPKAKVKGHSKKIENSLFGSPSRTHCSRLPMYNMCSVTGYGLSNGKRVCIAI